MFLDRFDQSEPDEYEVLADMAEAYVATTIAGLSRLDAGRPATLRNPEQSRKIEEIRTRIEALEGLIVRLRELRVANDDRISANEEPVLERRSL